MKNGSVPSSPSETKRLAQSVLLKGALTSSREFRGFGKLLVSDKTTDRLSNSFRTDRRLMGSLWERAVMMKDFDTKLKDENLKE